jgi:hypothetical protein
MNDNLSTFWLNYESNLWDFVKVFYKIGSKPVFFLNNRDFCAKWRPLQEQAVSHYVPCFLGIPGHLLSLVVLPIALI